MICWGEVSVHSFDDDQRRILAEKSGNAKEYGRSME